MILIPFPNSIFLISSFGIPISPKFSHQLPAKSAFLLSGISIKLPNVFSSVDLILSGKFAFSAIIETVAIIIDSVAIVSFSIASESVATLSFSIASESVATLSSSSKSDLVAVDTSSLGPRSFSISEWWSTGDVIIP